MSATCKVSVVLDSISTTTGERVTTLCVRYPRIIHAQVLRHGLIAHSVASSRAIPTSKMVDSVHNSPFIPTRFLANQPGMSPSAVEVTGAARSHWLRAAGNACDTADALHALGLHKQWANRVLEPFLYVDELMTSTNWHPFLALRRADSSQAEIQELANAIRDALLLSEPVYRDAHRPYHDDPIVSAGIIARASYGHMGSGSQDEHLARARGNRLAQEGHLSPFEHICEASATFGLHGKHAFRGWVPMAVSMSPWESQHRSAKPLPGYQ